MARPQPLNVSALDDSYAAALVELAEQHNQLDEIADEMQQLLELGLQQPDLARLLEARRLDEEQRTQLLKNLFEGRVSDLTFRFLRVLIRKDRLGRLPEIARAVQRRFRDRRNVLEVDAWVPDAVDEEKRQDFAQRLGEALGAAVEINFHEDPELLGGMKLRIGDRIVDASVRTQLHTMRRQLVEAGKQKARQTAESLPLPEAS